MRNIKGDVDGGRFIATVQSNFDFVELENEFKPPAVWKGPDFGLTAKDSADLDRQADVYASVYKMALASRNCHGVQVWGFTDKYSWIPGFSRGRNGTALLFDKDYMPKPAFKSVEAVFQGK